ncbi:hypothetical protein S40293_08797 [Stachybotrys chartarum IBT 40293]|nr:hypothetical protein S40293_08797 [Stachybotrys chartarum IBT 40293]
MVDGWRMLAVACSHTVSGTYIASSLRLGKIHECTAAAAVLALAATSKEHCDRFPELHAHQPRASCGDPRRFGIPCFCQGDRLTSALANLSPSPSLNIAPACIVSQWQTSRREFFGDQIANHGSKTLSSRPLISTIVARQQQLGTQSAFAGPVERKHLQPRLRRQALRGHRSEPLPVATGSRPLVLSGCFLPSAAFVDEFTENKGAGASFVKALTAMVSTSIAANPSPSSDSAESNPRRSQGEAPNKPRSADTVDATLEVGGRLQPPARDVLGVCTFNQPFLGGRVPDPRPDILRCPIPPRFEAKISDKIQAMRRAQRHNQLIRQRDFGLDLVCSVLPGAFNLPDDRVEGSCKGGILDGGSAPGMIRDIQCGQLDAVEARRHLLAGCAVARHSMVLAMKPRVAVPTALHRRRVLPCSFVVHAVGAAFLVHALTIHRRPGNNRPRRRDQRCCRKLRLGQPPGAREEQQARGHATRRTVFRS